MEKVMTYRRIQNALTLVILMLLSACVNLKGQQNSGEYIKVNTSYADERYSLVLYEDSVFVLVETVRNRFSYGSWSIQHDGDLHVDSRMLPFESSSSSSRDAYRVSTGFIRLEGVDFHILANECIKIGNSSQIEGGELVLCPTLTIPDEIADLKEHIDSLGNG